LALLAPGRGIFESRCYHTDDTATVVEQWSAAVAMVHRRVCLDESDSAVIEDARNRSTVWREVRIAFFEPRHTDFISNLQAPSVSPLNRW